MSLSRASLRLPSMLLWLTILWIALWGDVTWANLVGGLAVAAGVVLFARLDSASLRPTYFRPQWALYYVATLVGQLFVSNLRLAWEVLTPGDGTHTAIIAVPIRGGSDAVVNLVANSITLTPGTMTLDVKRHDGGGRQVDRDNDLADSNVTLYVHSMYAADVELVRHDVLRLEELALRAFGSNEDYEKAHLDVVRHERLIDTSASPRQVRPPRQEKT